MKNWTINEAVNVINDGTDAAAIRELAKHFPEFFMTVVKGDMVALANAMGDKFTVRKLNFGSATSAADDANEAGVEAEVDESDASDDADLNALSTKQLMQLCDKRGIKVPHYGKNKQFYLDALNAAASDSDESESEDESTNPYEGKTAMELFKMCKERGIKAVSKKPAKYYVDLLVQADAEPADAESEGDWEDDETPAPKSSKKPAPKKPAPKKAPQTEPAADEDDDWDI